MAPKKMSLVEFLSDQSLGGSWADDEIDLSSISVPIEKNSHRSNNYSSNSYYNNSSSIGGGNNYPGSGPPYIVKLLNLPVTANDAFIEDLFQSRYTKVAKFKILFDPSTNVLTTKIIKKISFVELLNLSDFNKVLKWHDLYYNMSKKIIPELANFDDFKDSIKFNEENAVKLKEIETEFLQNKPSSRFGAKNNTSPLPNNSLKTSQISSPTPFIGQHLNSPSQSVQSKKKSNPFGNAKPVDVLSKQLELEKKLDQLAINHTTFKTLGDGVDESETQNNSALQSSSQNGKEDSKTKIPPPLFDESNKTKQTLADKLAAKVLPTVASPKPQGTKLSSSGKKSPNRFEDNSKPKPKVILKRRTTESVKQDDTKLEETESEVKESIVESSTSKENDHTSKNNSSTESEIENKLKAINDKLAKENNGDTKVINNGSNQTNEIKTSTSINSNGNKNIKSNTNQNKPKSEKSKTPSLSDKQPEKTKTTSTDAVPASTTASELSKENIGHSQPREFRSRRTDTYIPKQSREKYGNGYTRGRGNLKFKSQSYTRIGFNKEKDPNSNGSKADFKTESESKSETKLKIDLDNSKSGTTKSDTTKSDISKSDISKSKSDTSKSNSPETSKSQKQKPILTEKQEKRDIITTSATVKRADTTPVLPSVSPATSKNGIDDIHREPNGNEDTTPVQSSESFRGRGRGRGYGKGIRGGRGGRGARGGRGRGGFVKPYNFNQQYIRDKSKDVEKSNQESR